MGPERFDLRPNSGPGRVPQYPRKHSFLRRVAGGSNCMTREPKLTHRLLIALALFLCAAAAGCGVGPGNANADIPVDSEPTLGELVFEEDENLQKRLAAIGGAGQGKVGIYALLIEENRAVSVNGGERFAMQSVVKLPVAMAVLEMVSAGELKLDDKIEFSKNELANPSQRSLLRDKNPGGGSASVGELIRLA